MIKVYILGAGKLGTHLIQECINNPNISLVQIYNRSLKNTSLFKGMLPLTQSIYELKPADIYLVALPDAVLPTINLTHLKGLVIHTSGTTSYKQLKADRKGVWYPPQSFTKEKKLNWKNIPICIETEFEEDIVLLKKFSESISNKVYILNEQQRQKLHLAAVFANNFSNRVLDIAYDLCKENQIDFQILQPLIHETFLKTQILPPHIAQTGPALRNDHITIEKHKQQLKDIDLEVYKILTKSIQKKHGTEL